MARLSPGNALTAQEREFGKMLHAGMRPFMAFQRAFCYRRPSDAEFVCPPFGPEECEPKAFAAMLNTLEPIKAPAMAARADELSKLEHMRAYLDWLKGTSSDLARDTLVDHMVGADTKDQRAAALEVLKAEDKVGHADATQRWIEVCVEAGAEVVVPLPHEVSRTIACEACGHAQLVVIPLDVSFPMEKMFPRRKSHAA